MKDAWSVHLWSVQADEPGVKRSDGFIAWSTDKDTYVVLPLQASDSLGNIDKVVSDTFRVRGEFKIKGSRHRSATAV